MSNLVADTPLRLHSSGEMELQYNNSHFENNQQGNFSIKSGVLPKYGNYPSPQRQVYTISSVTTPAGQAPYDTYSYISDAYSISENYFNNCDVDVKIEIT